MSTVLNSDTVIPGIVYVMWVKDTKPYEDPDSIYAIVYKGNSKFGHQDFKYVSERENKKFMYCTKVNAGNENPTWQMCLDDLKVLKAPIGTPVTFIDRPYTFAEITAMAYTNKYFASEDGLAHLSKKTGPAVSSPAPLLAASAGKTIVAGAKAISDQLVQFTPSVSGAPPSLIPDTDHEQALREALAKGLDGSDAPGFTDISVDNGDILGEDVENLKERVVMAESMADAVKQENVALEAEVAELKVQLKSAMEHQKQFMVSSDVATVTVEKMNDDTSTKVVKRLDPKLSLLPAVNGNVASLLTMMTTLNTTIAGLPDIVGNKVETLLSTQTVALGTKLEGVASRIDTSLDSLSEGVSTTNDVLGNFGMAEDENSVDIPACIKSLVTLSQQAVDSPLPEDAGSTGVAQGCYYLSRQMLATLVCKCGCGFELQADNSLPGPGNGGQVPAPVPQQVVHLGGNQSPFVPGQHLQTFTAPAPVSNASQYSPVQQFYVPAQMSSTTQYVTPQNSQAPVHSTPPEHVSQMVPQHLSRKQKKLAKSQGLKAAKHLKFDPEYLAGKQVSLQSGVPAKGGGLGPRMASLGGQSNSWGPSGPSQSLPAHLVSVRPGFQPRSTLPNLGTGMFRPPPQVWVHPPRFTNPK